jgi:hypothetical protein
LSKVKLIFSQSVEYYLFIVVGQEQTILQAVKECNYIERVVTEEGNDIVFKLKEKHKYYGQVQLDMAILNLNVTDFVVFASLDKQHNFAEQLN